MGHLVKLLEPPQTNNQPVTRLANKSKNDEEHCGGFWGNRNGDCC